MKVWEKIMEHAAVENFKLDTIAKVQDWMYNNRVTPCDMEEQFDIIKENRKNELCGKFQLDCLSCLEEYLDMEVTP